MTAPVESTSTDTRCVSARKRLIILVLAGVTALAAGATPALASAGLFWPAVFTGAVGAFITAVGAAAAVVNLSSGHHWERK